MKAWLLFFNFVAFLCPAPKAATITAIANGNWTATSTWNLNRVPQNNDQVIIPFGRTVYFQNTPYSKSDIVARPTLKIDIFGTLDFSNAGNDKLYLDQGSTIEIYLLGKIQTTAASSEIIAIYNGTEDNTVWTGSPQTVWGPKSATGTTNGFQNALLPITLEYFEVSQVDENTARIIWQTSQETNTSKYEVEMLDLAANKWSTVSKKAAAGNSSTILKYEVFAPISVGVNQFRLKQIDIDGMFTYSSVKILNHQGNTLRLKCDPSSRVLYLEGGSDKALSAAIYTSSGVLVQKAILSDNNGIKIEERVRGLIIVVVRDHHAVRLSKKFAL